MRRTRRGMLLIEMLFVILLVGTTAVIVARLFGSTIRVYRDVPAASDDLRATAQWERMLRDDAWAARAVEVRSDGVTFGAAGGDVTWTLAAGVLSRTTTEATQRWPTARIVRWTRGGDALTVAIDDATVRLATPSLRRGEDRR